MFLYASCTGTLRPFVLSGILNFKNENYLKQIPKIRKM
jgi:hypothetical protein